MTDLSKLSDAQLAQLYATTPAAGMSDAELVAAHQAMRPQSAGEKLIGQNGSRYQTWPERAVREILGLPEKLVKTAGSAPAGSSELTENLVPASTETALAATPMSRAPALFGVKPKSIAAPSREALEQAAKDGYESARASGASVSPEALAGMQSKISNDLTEQGYVAATAPKTFGILKEMTPPKTAPGETIGPIGVSSIEAMRRGFRRAGADYTESDASRRAIKAIDEVLDKMSPELATARANQAAAFRSEDIGLRLERADRQAAKSGSGANLDNAIRQRVSQRLDSEGGKRGLSKDEIAQADRVVEGTAVGNVARVLSKLSPQHPLTGWPASVTGGITGTAAGGPVGGAIGAAVPPVVGMIAKMVAEKSTERQARLLDEMMRRRSPLYEEQLVAAPVALPNGVQEIVRLLMQPKEDNSRLMLNVAGRESLLRE